MTFDKLADRCLLFVDTEKNLLIELLKEAEIEMSRKCNINEASESYSDTGDSPIIPDMYHRDLCDYSIAIAAAKTLPELHTKHWSMWNNNLSEIRNEDADRELVHTIKEDI
jgi:hypothetical protein